MFLFNNYFIFFLGDIVYNNDRKPAVNVKLSVEEIKIQKSYSVVFTY